MDHLSDRLNGEKSQVKVFQIVANFSNTSPIGTLALPHESRVIYRHLLSKHRVVPHTSLIILSPRKSQRDFPSPKSHLVIHVLKLSTFGAPSSTFQVDLSCARRGDLSAGKGKRRGRRQDHLRSLYCVQL